PNGMILSGPRICGSSSLRIFTRPTTSSIDPEKYNQKIPLGNPKPANAAVRRASAKSTNSKSIPLTPISHCEPHRSGRVAPYKNDKPWRDLMIIRWGRKVRSNHGPTSITEIYFLHCRHSGKGVGRLCIAGVESRHLLGR